VRGVGLLIGVEFAEPIAKELVKEMAARGILANSTSELVLRAAPPLIVTREEIDAYVGALGDCLALRPALKSSIC